MVWLLWDGDFKVVVNGNGGAALAAVDQLGLSGECEKAPTRCPIRSGEEFNRNYPLAWAQRNNFDEDDDTDYGDGNLYLTITYLNGDGGTISYSSGAWPLWQEWQHFWRTFPAAPAGTAKVRIGFYFDNSGKNYLDDCAIVAPAPGGDGAGDAVGADVRV